MLSEINCCRLFEGVSSFAEQERKVAKLKCIINYFERVLSDSKWTTCILYSKQTQDIVNIFSFKEFYETIVFRNFDVVISISLRC